MLFSGQIHISSIDGKPVGLLLPIISLFLCNNTELLSIEGRPGPINLNLVSVDLNLVRLDLNIMRIDLNLVRLGLNLVSLDLTLVRIDLNLVGALVIHL